MNTLEEARAWLRERLDVGAECPCCTQLAKVYRRKINAGMAWALVRMYQINGTGWVHVPSQIGARSREEGKLAYWHLVEEATEPRPDGGRAGWWRVTDLGERFVTDRCYVPKYAYVYNGRCLSLDGSVMVGIRDCLGSKFDYHELMRGAA